MRCQASSQRSVALLVLLGFAVLVLCVLLYLVHIQGRSATRGAQVNYDYVRLQLGDVVLRYWDRHGRLPISFDIALRDSTTRLPHRGDYFGNPISYHRKGSESFFFISAGPNGRWEKGCGDDLVICYEKGTWFIGDATYVKDAFNKVAQADVEGRKEEEKGTVTYTGGHGRSGQ